MPIISKIIDKIIRLEGKLVVFDFDRTILKIHSHCDGVTMHNIFSRNLLDDFASKNFKEVVISLQKNNIRCAIASFGKKRIIKTYLFSLFHGEDNPILLDNNIQAAGNKLTKVQMLEKLRAGNFPPISSRNVLFFDDDEINIQDSLRWGYVNSYLVPDGGLSDLYWENWLAKN